MFHENTPSCRRARRRNHGLAHRRAFRQRGRARAASGYRRSRPANRNAAALKGIENAPKQRPGGFFTDDKIALIQPGNFEDDLRPLAECDWIIEAVVENLELKRDLWRKVDAVRKPDAILSTNTSGIPLAQISEGFSPQFRRHFLGTHFFNPPRYLHLMELIPGADTDPAILEAVEEFADRRLGKGVVRTKDTPNFIANRIGSFFGGTIAKTMVEEDFTIEEVDALTGPLIGLPNSASFRLLDLVGLDVWAFVGSNLYDAVPHDPWRDRFLPLDFEKKMIERKWLGDKTGQGFYKKTGKGDNKEIQVLDWKTLEYHPLQKPRFPVGGSGAKYRRPGRAAADSAALQRSRRQVSVEGLQRPVSVLGRNDSRDFGSHRRNRSRHALGLRQQAGPFELWDALGFVDVITRLETEHRPLARGRQEGAVARSDSRSTSTPITGPAAQPRISISIRRAISPLSRAPASSCSPI